MRREVREVRHFHLFCGLGGGAKGFNAAHARVGHIEARFRCLGGVDVEPKAVADFATLAGVPGTCLDLFSREQFVGFHGREPPADWREASPEDMRRAAGGERPHIVFTSPPCKGFSGLLPESRTTAPRYVALNALTLRGIWLALEAWADDPPEFFLLENVPRIAQRGRVLLDRIGALLRSYGYLVAETAHDCGELGNLAQTRKRFLLVARHAGKVRPFLYQPERRRLRAVGDVLGKMPMPGDPLSGPMHRVPALQWRTWVRLALVPAGKDWRALNDLTIKDGVVEGLSLVPIHLTAPDTPGQTAPCLGKPCLPEASHDPGGWAIEDVVPRYTGQYGQIGVQRWDQTSPTLGAQTTPGQGRFAVADPRPQGWPDRRQLGVNGWEDTSPTLTTARAPGQGRFSVADPRLGSVTKHNNCFRVVRWAEHSPAVTGGGAPSSGGLAVADPRYPNGYGEHSNKMRVVGFDGPSNTVTGSDRVGSGALSVADPRPEAMRGDREVYQTAGHYGVVPWEANSRAVQGWGQADNGPWSVADPRLPEATENVVAVIQALDGTWHRPFTTLELAALQGLLEPEEHLELCGLSDSDWRERIGNAVPPPAAQAIAGAMGHALLLAWTGEGFALSASPIWVRPILAAMEVAQ